MELKKHFISRTNNLYNNNRQSQYFHSFMSGGVDTDAFFWNICYCNDHISGGWEKNFFCNYIKNSWAIPNTSLFSFLFWTVLHLCMWSLKIKCNEMEQHRMAHNSSKGHYLLMVEVHCVVIRCVTFWGFFWHWFLEVQSTYMGKLISSFAQLLFQGLRRKATFPRVQHCSVLSIASPRQWQAAS